ncbi:MAG TPA: hypothetical protein ENN96_01375, partial [Candidatus Acetothermia bacterium]|nr:hypothetical protein [Candidatus Acetothermia bacterium]
MNAREARGLMKRIRIPILVMLLLVASGILGMGNTDDLAELVVVKIVLDPPPVVDRGLVVEVSADVMNTGARSADGFSISLFLRPQQSRGTWALHSTIESVSLPPSHQDAYRAAFYVDTKDLQIGTYDVRVVADSANLISETDKLNNELQTTMTIREAGLGLPDLQPVSLSYAPTNPGSEDDMEPWNVTTSIRNLGPVQAGQFVVAFLVNGEEFARQIRFILPAGGTTEIVAELDPQAVGLDPGTHSITVRVDPEEEVAEQDDGNNSISGFLTLQAVDLVPISLSFDKAVVRLDEEVRVTAQVRNDSNGVAKNVEVGFFVGHVRFSIATIPILGQGMTATVEGILRPDRSGLRDAPAIYQIKVVADPNELIYEVDKANNEMIRPVTIYAASEKMAELHPISIQVNPASPAELGRTGTVTIRSTIRNTGRAGAEGFRVSFFYRVKGGVRWEPIPCADAAGCSNLSLAAGLQSQHVASLPVSAFQPGVYELRVVVDGENVVAEVDKTNNELVTTLTLLAARLPDLTFCPLAPMSRDPVGDVQQGQTIRLSLCISNLGEQDAGAFAVKLSYCRVDPQAGVVGGACEGAYLQQHLLPP